ncbi:MAG TPA: hypothetical protein VN519_14175 [Bryobacteraceae bacterium]|nr:hypothetical protein [Bryobacteraceae bacterium]
MSLLPGLIGLTGGRSFAFYPPILGITHNEWRFRRATWADFVVVNTQSGDEACIPRSFLADVSANAPVVIVGLKRELEWRDGMAVPYRRPVVELPIAVNDNMPAPPRPRIPAPVVSIRLDPHTPAATGRKAVVVVMLGVVAAAVVADVARPGEVLEYIEGGRADHVWQQLKAGDDYPAVVSKLGQPDVQRTHIDEKGEVFRSLEYPSRRFTAILEGTTQEDARFVAAIDAHGRILGSPPGGVTAARLRSLPRF